MFLKFIRIGKWEGLQKITKVDGGIIYPFYFVCILVAGTLMHLVDYVFLSKEAALSSGHGDKDAAVQAFIKYCKPGSAFDCCLQNPCCAKCDKLASLV